MTRVRFQGDQPETITRRALAGIGPHLTLTLVPASGATYYELEEPGTHYGLFLSGDLLMRAAPRSMQQHFRV